MNKKRGFTLIELLAVIVILAIIALIAVPIILNIISNVKEGAIKRSADAYVAATENSIVDENLNNPNEPFLPSECLISNSEGNLICTYTKGEEENTKPLEPKIDGQYPISGEINFDDKGGVESGELYYLIDPEKPDSDVYIVKLGEDNSTIEKISTATNIWDGKKVSKSLAGCGTSSSPYLIQSAADLAYMRNQVNAGANIKTRSTCESQSDYDKLANTAKYKQTINIELNSTKKFSEWYKKLQTGSSVDLNEWVAIGVYTDGDYSKAFRGEYDGGNFKISGIYTKGGGLFGVVSSYNYSGAKISNLKITKSYITNDSTSYETAVGGVISVLHSAFPGGSNYITNVSSDVEITTGKLAGGLVGKMIIDGASMFVTNSSYTGKITNGNYAGGLTSYVTGDGHQLDINGFTNSAEIQSSSGSIGGLIGYYNHGLLFITNSTNNGKITSSSGFSGGLVGQYYYTGSGSKTTTINNSHNNGDINCGGGSVGGFIGYYYLDSQLQINNNSTNKGNITGTTYLGGFVGYLGKSPSLIIDDSINEGNIIGTGGRIGGFIGDASGCNGGFTIQKSKNKGNITINASSNSNYVGGIVGQVSAPGTKITETTNEGKIDAEKINDVGGIVGYFNGSALTLNNVTNTNDIKADYNVGGIVGYIYSNVTFSSITNKGKISAKYNNIGGIVGYLSITGTGNLYSLHNEGDIEIGIDTGSYSVYAGGVVGQYNSGTTSIVESSNTGNIEVKNICSNCKYQIGGIVGNRSNNFEITDSYNAGNITSVVSGNDNYIGGLIGFNSASTSITHAYNVGNVTGGGYIGGLIGANWNSVSIYNSYNAGNITANSAISGKFVYLGGLVGNVVRLNNSNSYNVGQLKTSLNTFENYINENNGMVYIGGIFGYAGSDTLQTSNIHNKGTITNSITNSKTAGIGIYYSSNTPTISSTSYLSSVASGGILLTKNDPNSWDSSVTATDSVSDMPDLLTVINNDMTNPCYKADTNNINKGYPIFNWQEPVTTD